MTVGVAGQFFAVQVHVGTRVGRVHFGGRAVGGAVVGQRKIDFAIAVVDCAPLWAVHLGGPHRVCSMAGVDQHIGLVGKLIGRVLGNARVSDVQLQPFTLAARVKTCGVQLAFAQVFVTHQHAAAHVTRIPHGSGHKLVDVLIARVTAHVKGQRFARLGRAAHSGFVGKTAHRRALGRRGVGGQWVDLDDKTKGIGFVAEIFFGVRTQGSQVPTGKAVVCGRHGVPALAGGFFGTRSGRSSGHAIAFA